MKKQIFTIILLLMGGVAAFGQFKLDGGTSSVRLQTGGVDRLYVQPVGAPGFYGNIGINTITPNAKLTVAGDMALQKIQRETGSGGYNDYDRQDASIAIFENGGTIGGIQGGSKGQMLYVLCGYGNNQSALTIRHDSPLNPTAANRILTHTGADFVISGGAGGVLLIYDDTKARWRIVETPSGSGTAGWGLTGNSGTNPTTQFIGTTDAQPLAFKTNNTERMRILSDGKVGIGTNVPDRKLHVYNGNSGRTPYSFTSLFTESSSHNYLEIASPDASERGIIFSSTTDGTGGSGGIYYENKAMSFRTNTNDTQMKILANGNVGIGTTNPTAKLEVNNIRGATVYNQLIYENSNELPTLGLRNLNGGVTLVGKATPNVLNVGNFDASVFAPVAASAFNVISDITAKKEIINLGLPNYDEYLSQIRNIQSATYRYNWEDTTSRTTPHIGFIAQSLPNAVISSIDKTPANSSEKILGYNLSDMAGLTLIGLKAVDAKMQQMEEIIKKLLAEIQILKNK